MHPSQTSSLDTNLFYHTPMVGDGRYISSVTDKSAEKSERDTASSNVSYAGHCALGILQHEDSTNAKGNLKHLIVKRDEGGVHFIHLETANGAPSKIVEEVWAASANEMVGWLNKHYPGETIQWILPFPQK